LRRVVFKNFRIADCAGDGFGSLVVENGFVKKVLSGSGGLPDAAVVIDGGRFPGGAVLMPAFVDLHAHFRDPGFPEKETLESASLAAAAGGFATAVCMANTNPVIDTPEKARALKARADALGLVDLYPVLSLTKNMDGGELSGITELENAADANGNPVLMLSEDGKDVADDGLFLAAMAEAKRLGLPVSCHCDLGDSLGGTEARAVRRAIELGVKAGCRIHVAHVSTGETVDVIRRAKANTVSNAGFTLTCETTPHHIGATEADAGRMGLGSFGRVNPPLSSEADRAAVLAALLDGTVDAVATDHAPHSRADKAAGAPGFTGLETAFAVCLSAFSGAPDLRRVSALLSANPARVLGLRDRGRVAEGLRADFVIADVGAAWTVDPAAFRSRGKCTPFEGRELRGKILMTINAGRVVFDGGSYEQY